MFSLLLFGGIGGKEAVFLGAWVRTLSQCKGLILFIRFSYKIVCYIVTSCQNAGQNHNKKESSKFFKKRRGGWTVIYFGITVFNQNYVNKLKAD